MQEQRQVFPRREGVAGEVQEGIKRLVTTHVHAIALERQPEHADDAKHPRCHQHPQRNPAADNADKQEDREGNDDIRTCPAYNHVGQQTERHRAHQEEQPRLAVLAQEIDHQHRRDEEIEETLKCHARHFGRKYLAVRMQLEQQKAVMHEENTDADQGDNHQHHPCQVRFHPIHGEQRATRGVVYRA
ncbi:hypothetical protein D3C86_1488860 [compost metagenome]